MSTKVCWLRLDRHRFVRKIQQVAEQVPVCFHRAPLLLQNSLLVLVQLSWLACQRLSLTWSALNLADLKWASHSELDAELFCGGDGDDGDAYVATWTCRASVARSGSSPVQHRASTQKLA